MLKRFVITLMTIASGVVGSVVASRIATEPRLLSEVTLSGWLMGAALMALLLSAVQHGWPFCLSWRWHRYWYMRDLLANPALRKWESGFARLYTSRRGKRFSTTEIIRSGEREDLLETLCLIIIDSKIPVRRAIILGEPGSGKTTTLERLCVWLARRGVRRLGFGTRIPVLLRLGTFAQGELLDYIKRSMARSTRGKAGTALIHQAEILIKTSRVVLLLDALDEALGDRRTQVLAELRDFMGSRLFKDCPVVITCRSREVPGLSHEGLAILEIQPLTTEAVKFLISIHKDPTASEEAIYTQLERQGLLELQGIGRNPFWLQLIVASGVFDRGKVHVLNTAVDTLLKREWDEKPETRRSWNRVLPREDQLSETKKALAQLAHLMSLDDQVAFSRERAIRELQNRCLKDATSQGLNPRDVLTMGDDAQILVYDTPMNFGDDRQVRFRHRLLQEFLTAWALSTDNGWQHPQFMDKRLGDVGWWNVLLMLSELVSDLSGLFEIVVGDGSDEGRVILGLALISGKTRPGGELESLASRIFKATLRHGITSTHRTATVTLSRIIGEDTVIELLCKLTRPYAWGDVELAAIALLGELKSECAARALIHMIDYQPIEKQVRAAIVAVGEAAIGPLEQELSSPGPLIRLEAVELLEQIGESRAVSLLIKALKDSSSSVSLAARDSLVQIGEPAVMPLIQAFCDSTNVFRSRAAITLGSIGDERAIPVLVDALYESDDTPVRNGGLYESDKAHVRDHAAIGLGHIGDVRAVEPLIQALSDPHPMVRSSVCWALGRIGDRRALEPLQEARKDVKWTVGRSATKAIESILSSKKNDA